MTVNRMKDFFDHKNTLAPMDLGDVITTLRARAARFGFPSR
ncbi:MAG: hypothetical protein ACOYMK_06860 [Hyphomonadaceae bacterium]